MILEMTDLKRKGKSLAMVVMKTIGQKWNFWSENRLAKIKPFSSRRTKSQVRSTRSTRSTLWRPSLNSTVQRSELTCFRTTAPGHGGRAQLLEGCGKGCWSATFTQSQILRKTHFLQDLFPKMKISFLKPVAVFPSHIRETNVNLLTFKDLSCECARCINI